MCVSLSLHLPAPDSIQKSLSPCLSQLNWEPDGNIQKSKIQRHMSNIQNSKQCRRSITHLQSVKISPVVNARGST